MHPDVTTAAIKAAETLIKYRISAAPVDPLPILKALPGVIVVPYTEIAEKLGTDRKQILSTFEDAKDAVAQAKEWAELKEKADSASHKGKDIWIPLEELYGPDGGECEVE